MYLFFRLLKIKMNKKSKCKVCDQEFSYLTELLSHLKVHFLQEHVNSVSSQEEIVSNEFKCDYCENSFISKESKLKHVNSVHLILKVPCSMCKETFAHKPSLERHVKTVHNGEKNYNCDFCVRSFTRKESLKDHVNSIHLTQKFKCEQCKGSFKYLSRHMKKVHNEKIKNSEQVKCLFCDKVGSKARISRHTISIHKDEDSFPCDICEKDFTSVLDLKIHMRTHQVKSFNCE